MKSTESKAEPYKWVQIRGIVEGGLEGKILQSPQNKSIYVVGLVGCGRTSKAYRVVTKDGYEGVLKMYVRKTDDNKMVIKNKTFMKIAEKSVKKELKIFQNTYPTMPVSKVEFAGHHCLFMPFFRPLNFKEQLPPKEEICEVLKTIQGADSESLYYKDDDVSWRHFGMYRSKVVAFDFNNMEIIDSNDDPDTKIENQVGNLFESIEM